MCEQITPKCVNRSHQSRSTHLPAFPRSCALAGRGRLARPRCPRPAPRGKAQAQPWQSRSAARRPPPHTTRGSDNVHAPCRQGASPCSRPAPCETNTHYPCCSTLRIEAQLAARAAHLPAPAAPRSAPRPSSATRGWRRHHGAGQVWPGPSVTAGPCLRRLSCFRAQRSRQRQILQLLQLAQAASDYLKPQPFFYGRRAQTLDRSISTCSDGSRDH